PKIIAAVFFFPVLIIFSMGVSLIGGYYAVVLPGMSSASEYIFGIRAFFEVSSVVYALVKACVFAFVIVSVSSYFGYYTKGGALDVGRSSTHAVVWSSIVILVGDLILTQLFLV